MNKNIKNILKIIFFFLLAIGFVWWFVSKLSKSEINQMFQSFKNANYFWFIVAVLINLFSHYIRAIRWKQLLKPLGVNVNVNSTFFAVISGYLVNLAIPRLGEIVRSTMVSRKNHIPFDKTIGTIITERAIDLILFFIIIIVSFFMEADIFKEYIFNNFNFDINKWKTIGLLCLGVCVLVILSLFLFRNRLKNNKIFLKIKDFVIGILEGMKTILKLDKPLLFIFYSLLIWFMWILGTFVLFQCLNQTCSLSFKVAMVVTVVGAIGPMVTPGGIGIFPTIFADTLHVYSISKPIGYALGWLCWIVSQLGVIILGPIGFISFAKNKKNNESNK
ncbi:MAG: flippase-like domain-containing protein [Bacteroidales bacterium]|jgi:uncharacterized protein (TIRG00374 family)|nr:flippase-like domain-containing protein [Bacteroidales bacterium]